MFVRRFGLYFEARRIESREALSVGFAGINSSTNAADSDLRISSLFQWTAILPLLLILLPSGCGGLSVTSKSAIVATPATIAFGNVSVGQTATANITLQNQGLNTVQIESLSVSGSSFSVGGTTSFPISLAPGASVILQLQFSPTVSGRASEPLMITSSLSLDPASIAQVNGNGVAGTGGNPKVQLSWVAPDSPSDPVIGYTIYRSASGTTYQRLNSSIDQNTAYTDTTVQSGGVYDYYVESVDAAGASSPPSNSTTITVP